MARCFRIALIQMFFQTFDLLAKLSDLLVREQPINIRLAKKFCYLLAQSFEFFFC